MPLILTNHEEAPGVRQQWLQGYDKMFGGEMTPKDIASAKFARLVTDNVRALAAYRTDCEHASMLIITALEDAVDEDSDWEINPVETARLRLLRMYMTNLRQWRTNATRAYRQWRFSEDHGSGSKDPHFELPKDGWEERDNVERSLNELDPCTDRLPPGWGGGPFGQERVDVEVVFEAGDVRVQDGAEAEGAGDVVAAATPGLVDYSDTESGSDTESEDDFVLTVNGLPTYNGRPIEDQFPGGEAAEETTGEEEEESDSGDSDDSDGLVDLMERTSDALEEWEAANREMPGGFIDGRFVEHAE